jgi:MFS family permease
MLGTIFFTVFIDLLGFGIVLPLSPFYAEGFGASAFQIGLLMASYSMMQFFFAPIWGRVSDRIGRRPILLMSIFGGGVSFFIFAGAKALWVLYAARLLQGMFGANISTAQAVVADVTTKENRAKMMGALGAAFGLGFIFGPAIGAKLVQWGPGVGNQLGAMLQICNDVGNGPVCTMHPKAFLFFSAESVKSLFGLGFPALFASLLCFSNFTLAYFRLPETLKAENRNTSPRKIWMLPDISRALVNPKTGWLIWMFFISTFGLANMEATLALFTEKRLGYSVHDVGNLFAFTGVMMAFTQGYLLRKFQPKLGERKTLLIGMTLSTIGLGAIALVTATSSLGVVLALMAIGGGFANPTLLAEISVLTDPKEQGSILGVTQGLSSLARVLGPACGGFLFSAAGPGAPYLAGGALMALALCVCVMNRGKLVVTAGKVAAGLGH